MAINLGDISRFKYLAHKVMPLVFDETLSYYEFLCKVIVKLNEVIDNENEQNATIEQFGVDMSEWEEDAIQKYNEFTAAIDLEIEQFEESITEQQTEFEGTINDAWDEFIETYQRQFGIANTTGTSTTDAMSQKATTDELNDRVSYAEAQNKSSTEKLQALENLGADGAIAGFAKTGTSGLDDIYTLTALDGSTTTFTVSNGKSIEGISKTSTVGLVDTYTIRYNDNTTSTFTITNGAKGDTGDTGATGATGNGIVSISKTGTSGNVDTYTITYSDSSTSTFTVTNGNSVTGIAKTGTSGLTDTYTISYSDGTTSTFQIVNGNGVVSIVKTGTAGLVDTYTITYSDGTTATFSVTNGEKGETGDAGNGITSIEKTGTSGNVDTYTISYTNGTSTTFTVTNGAVTSVDGMTGDVTLDNKANVTGTYPDMVVGNSMQLVPTTQITNETPYVFRTTAVTDDVGSLSYQDDVIGATVVWNQLLNNGNFESTTGWTVSGGTQSVSNNEITLTINNTAAYSKHTISNAVGHKILMMCDAKVGTAEYAVLEFYGGTGDSVISRTTSSTYERLGVIGVGTDSTQIRVRTEGTAGQTGMARNAVAYDLTAMFGSSIADRAYTMEQSTAGSGVAWLQSYGFFTKPYYAYTGAPSLQSVKTSAHETIGFNQWDEEWEQGSINPSNGSLITTTQYIRSKNFCRCLPNTVYCITNTNDSSKFIVIHWYDGNQNYIGYTTNNVTGHIRTSPSNAYFFKVRSNNTNDYTSYSGGWCVNLSWDGERNGEYVPYDKRVYEYDDNVTLKGRFTLDANNDIKYIGDTYHYNGTVDRVRGSYTVPADAELTAIETSTAGWTQFVLSISGKTDVAAVGNVSIVTDSYYDTINYNGYLAINDSITKPYIVDYGTGVRFVLNVSTTADALALIAGMTIEYDLATPTTEEATAFTHDQIVNDWGTERWVDAAYIARDRDFEMPVGHSTRYVRNLVHKLQHLPSLGTSGNGLYHIQQTGTQMTLVSDTSDVRLDALEDKVPNAPDEDETYTLTCTVSSGTKTYSWVSNS